MIRNTIFAAAAALALTAGAAVAQPAQAQSAYDQSIQSVTQADVGHFVRDQNGTVIGSLKAVEGNQAVVWYGFFNTPGNHLETVPLGQLASNGGRLVLNGEGAHYAAR